MRVVAHYYQQFDADPTRDAPAQTLGGWKSDVIEIAEERTALVVMHAWDTGTAEAYPGWYRAVDYLPRANRIGREVLPGLLAAVRASRMRPFHVVGGGEYYKDFPGYLRAVELAGPRVPPLPRIDADPTLNALRRFREQRFREALRQRFP